MPLHNKAAFNLVIDFLKCILHTQNPWVIFEENELDICNQVWNEALDAMTIQQRAIGMLNGTQYV